MSNDQRSKVLAAWRVEFEAWAALEARVREVTPDTPESEQRELFRAWWSASGSLLLAAVHCQVHFGVEPDPPPFELMAKLSVIALDLQNGNVSPLIEKTKAQGRRATWDAERRDIGRAVRYLEAVKEGKIDDHRHTQTVCEAYGVKAPTVRGWQRNAEHFLYRLPRLNLPADRIVKEMREAGQRYRLWGHSETALIARSRRTVGQEKA
jgi:hypothetical protein